MKRTIKEVYDLIKEKINNAQLDRVSRQCKGIDSIILEGEINAYNDVLCLIESSHLLEEDESVKGSGLEFIERELKYYKEHIGWYDDGHKISQQEVDEYENVYKELKALEIIKKLPKEEKQILLNAVYCQTKSEEEYDLLKEELL